MCRTNIYDNMGLNEWFASTLENDIKKKAEIDNEMWAIEFAKLIEFERFMELKKEE